MDLDGRPHDFFYNLCSSLPSENVRFRAEGPSQARCLWTLVGWATRSRLRTLHLEMNEWHYHAVQEEAAKNGPTMQRWYLQICIFKLEMPMS